MPIPHSEADVIDALADAAREHISLALRGGASKNEFGAPVSAPPLDMRGLAGVIDYDPAELVITVRSGTRLAEVEAIVATEQQMLAFEPFDHGPIFGRPTGRTTVGGVIAAGVAGSRRVSAGGARDHVLGLRAVSGRAEVFVAGGKVVKNVTGYDLPKLATGSWGRLFAITELSLKVVPRPQTCATRIISGLSPVDAVRAMAVAMGSTAQVAAAAHLPGSSRERARTAVRIEGFASSVAARNAMLERLLNAFGAVETLSDGEAVMLWEDVRTLAPLGRDRPLWRINVAPSAACSLISRLEPAGAEWLLDWAGSLVWLTFDGDLNAVRNAAASAGGHAMLVRAPPELRELTPALHPQPPALAALETRVRRAFDPAGVFETGRF